MPGSLLARLVASTTALGGGWSGSGWLGTAWPGRRPVRRRSRVSLLLTLLSLPLLDQGRRLRRRSAESPQNSHHLPSVVRDRDGICAGQRRQPSTLVNG